MLLTRQYKKSIVIECYNVGVNILDIAREVSMSFSDISHIIRESTGQKKLKTDKSDTSRDIQLFSIMTQTQITNVRNIIFLSVIF